MSAPTLSRGSRGLCMAAALVAGCLASSGAWAVPRIFGQLLVDAGDQQSNRITLEKQGATPLNVSIAQDNDGALETWRRQATSSVTAKVGAVGVSAHATYFHQAGLPKAPSGYARAYAYADAGWLDSVTIDAPGLTGTPAYWVTSLAIEGEMGLVAAADRLSQSDSASVLVMATGLQLPPQPFDRCSRPDPGLACLSVAANRHQEGAWVLPLQIAFVYGQPFDLAVRLIASASVFATACDACDLAATIDFAHTLKWNGTTAITGADGLPVTGYTIASGSGFDYRLAAAVPEPGTAVLGALGLIVIAARRASSHRKPDRI